MKRSAPLARRTPLRAKPSKPVKEGKVTKPKAKRIKPRRKSNPAHLAKVAALPCVACLKDGCITYGVECHHIRTGIGKGMKADDTQTLSLCAMHHRTGGLGVAFHAGPKTWQGIFGTEIELLETVMKMLGGSDAA